VKILVCGGRYYTEQDFFFRQLDFLNQRFDLSCVIHGAAQGADSLAAMWATQREVSQLAFPAKWMEHGMAAGPERNQRMLGAEPDLVVAFAGGQGTGDMVRRAKKAKIPVWEPDKEPDKEF